MLLIIILAAAFIAVPRLVDFATRALAALTDQLLGENEHKAPPFDRDRRIRELKARHTLAVERGAIAAADQLEAEIREQERAS